MEIHPPKPSAAEVTKALQVIMRSGEPILTMLRQLGDCDDDTLQGMVMLCRKQPHGGYVANTHHIIAEMLNWLDGEEAKLWYVTPGGDLEFHVVRTETFPEEN